MLEFLVLASSNIEMQRYSKLHPVSRSEQAISDAWKTKFEQAYEKAKLCFGHTQEFAKMQAIYEKKNSQIREIKLKQKLFWVGFISLPLVILGLFLALGFGIKDIQDKQRIEAENYEEILRVQREEGQYARHMHTSTGNFGVYQVEKQAEVGTAGANALGQMGANGAGCVNLGGGEGFNMAAMMASMAVGGALGHNIAGAMNNMMGGITQPTPPPIPAVQYHVAVNGQPTGAFDLPALTQMAAAGQLSPDSLVWKSGMAQWAKAGTTEELNRIFGAIPPIPSES